jgi:hypothetical protein
MQQCSAARAGLAPGQQPVRMAADRSAAVIIIDHHIIIT